MNLLNALRLGVRTYKGVEDGEDMTAVIHHTRKNVSKLWIAFRFPVPFGKNDGGHFNISPQLLSRITAQEQAVEKGCLTLREVKIMHDFGGNELWHRGHGERCSLQKSASASSRTAVSLPRSG